MNGSGDIVRMYELMKIDNSFFTASKRSSLQTYFEKLSGAESVILVHNTFITRNDIDFLVTNRSHQLVSLCVCINANLYIEKCLPPLKMLAKSGLNMVLGTDSLASNYSLNMLDEMKTIQQNFPEISLEQMLKWVTFNGAMALKLTGVGSFERGNQPGAVLLENLDGLKLKDQTSSKRIL